MINDDFSNVHIVRRPSRENLTWDDTCPTVTRTSTNQLRLERPERDQGAPSPAQQNVRPSVNSPSVEPQILPEDHETRILYLRHCNTIQIQENSGNRVKDRYNFTLHEMTASTLPEMVRRIFRQQTTAFKINLSFGFMLRNVETGELRYYHPSQNNARFFDVPHLSRTEEDLQKFLDDFSRHDMFP